MKHLTDSIQNRSLFSSLAKLAGELTLETTIMTRMLSEFIPLKRVGFAVLLLGMCFISHAQGPDTLWTSIFNRPDASYMTSHGLAYLDSNRIYVSGEYNSLDGGTNAMFLAKHNSGGTLEWLRSCGDTTLYTSGADICSVGEELLAMVGRNWNDRNDPHLVIVDPEGTTVVESTFVTPGEQEFIRIGSANSDRLLLVYKTVAIPSVEESIDWLALDIDGNVIGEGSYALTDHRVWPMNMDSYPDGSGYAICGYIAPTSEFGIDVLILRIDSEGNLVWSRSYDHWDEDYAYDVSCLSTGECVFGGTTYFYDVNFSERPFAMKLDADGDSLWSWEYPPQPHTAGGAIHSLTRTMDGGITISYNLNFDFYLAHYLGDDSLAWTTLHSVYPTYVRNTSVGLFQGVSGSYFVAGDCFDSVNTEYNSSYLIRTESETSNADDRLNPLAQELSLSTFPNPFNSTLSIALDVPLHRDANVALYDLLGREVEVIYRGRLADNVISYVAPGSLSSGVYFVRAEVWGQAALRKVVLLK